MPLASRFQPPEFPDPVQTTRFLEDRLMGDRPAPQSMPPPYPVDTVDDRGPDFRFTEEELRMPRRKLMEPVR